MWPTHDDDPFGALSSELLAHITGAHITTARRWKRQGPSAPAPVQRLIRIIARGDMGAIYREWTGWTIRPGGLISPEGWELGMGEIRAAPLHRAWGRRYDRQLRNLQADWIDGRFQPVDARQAPAGHDPRNIGRYPPPDFYGTADELLRRAKLIGARRRR